MTPPSASTILACLALLIMGIVTVALIFFAVPPGNSQLVTFSLGAIAGALTVGGANKVADKITNSTSGMATIQADGEK